MRRVSAALGSILALALAVPAVAAESHPFNVQDLVGFDRISEPAPSPDGTRVVFTMSVLDLPANKRRTDLWISGADGTGPRRLTSHEAADTSPRWSTDGRTIYFLSTRSGSSQVWKVSLAGGEAEPVTTLPLDVGAFLLSPDGARLVVAMDTFPDCAELACTTKRLDEAAKKPSSGQIYDRLFFRHWDTWVDGRRSHLFSLPASGGAEAVDLMKGMDADCPSKPFGGVEEFAFTPDGKSVVLTARDAGREEAWSTNFDLFVVAADGSGKPSNLTAANKAWDTQPVFSPDGKTLAYLAMAVPAYEADRYRIVVRDWPNGAPKVLSEAWDRSPGSIAWAEDGKSIYAVADHLGQTALFAVGLTDGKARLVVKEGSVSSPVPAAGRVFYTWDDFKSPAEVYSVKPDGTDAKAITRINAPRLAVARMGDFEQFTFKGAKNETVYGFAVKPVDFDPAKKYPVALLIHGGPQNSWSNHFHYRWNAQNYAGAGYASVIVDFHGSTGYGQSFTDAIQGDWGGKPLEDLKKGLAAALAKYPWMDGGRVSALGASFGGYMINWIAGNWPDRFRCLVSHDGNLDERMAYFDTEELWFPERDHMGTPWDNPQGYDRQSPVNHVKNWKTPMLVIHSGKDFRVVETQGMSVFTVLQRRGIPSRFLYFPDENHWVLKPQNSILWHETVLAWLDQWTKK